MLAARSLKPAIIESIPMLGRTKPKVWLEAYGCSASMADSEMISGLLKESGYELATKQSEGTLNLIVTCSVKDTTEHRMVSRIKAMSKSGKPLVVAGCLPKADPAKVEALNPSASLLGPHSIENVAAVVGSGIMGERLAAGNGAIALLANTLATGAALVALVVVERAVVAHGRKGRFIIRVVQDRR